MSEIRKPWTTQEDDAVRKIVGEIGVGQWSALSLIMSNEYHLKGRSGKQCRERWHNHLDPKINKNPWSQKEQQIIFSAHKKYGNRWRQIAHLLQGRTDNSVKNHFYSTIRRSLRRISKALGQRNSTVTIRYIKPLILSQIFTYAQSESHNQNNENQQMISNCKTISQILLEFATFKLISKKTKIQQPMELKLKNLDSRILQFIKQSKNKLNKKIKTKNYEKQSQTHNHKVEQSSIQRTVIIIKNPQQNKIIKQQLSYLNQKQNNLNDNNIIQEGTIYDWNQFYKNCQYVQNFQIFLETMRKNRQYYVNKQIILNQFKNTNLKVEQVNIKLEQEHDRETEIMVHLFDQNFRKIKQQEQQYHLFQLNPTILNKQFVSKSIN